MPKRKAANDLDCSATSSQIAQPDRLSASSATETELISEANKLDSKTFRERHLPEQLMQHQASSLNQNFAITLQTAESLSRDEVESCFSLIETTSRKDYEAAKSFGWHPRRKMREMTQRDMRYLLIRRQGTKDCQVEGFLSFMLTFDSAPCVPVLYVYEIHVTPSIQGHGLGKHMLRLAESIARSVGLKKLMLTCILINKNAHAFYQKLGFEKDFTSPEDRRTRRKVVKSDYVILSKNVQQAPSSSGAGCSKRQTPSQRLDVFDTDDIGFNWPLSAVESREQDVA